MKPKVVLRLPPVLLHADVVDERSAAAVHHEVEDADVLVPDEAEQQHGPALQQVVNQVKLHRHQVPVLPSGLGSLT